MENPNTWTPLHHTIANILRNGEIPRIEKISSIQQVLGPKVSRAEIESAIEGHENDMRCARPGCSLESRLLYLMVKNDVTHTS